MLLVGIANDWRRLRWHAWSLTERLLYRAWCAAWARAAHLDGAVWVEVEGEKEGREN